MKSFVPVCKCGHIKKHHAYDSALKQFAGECSARCHCLHYRAPSCLCGHPADLHAAGRLECWSRSGTAFCRCNSYRAASPALLRLRSESRASAAVGDESSTHQDRRIALRFRPRGPLDLKLEDTAAQLVDLSEFGCGVEHEQPIARGKKLALDIETERLHLHLSARVLRCNLQPETSRYSSGLCFDDVDGTTALNLASLLQESFVPAS